MICTVHWMLLGGSDQGGLDGQSTWHFWGRRWTGTGFWWENLNERDHLEGQGLQETVTLIWIIQKGKKNELFASEEGLCCMGSVTICPLFHPKIVPGTFSSPNLRLTLVLVLTEGWAGQVWGPSHNSRVSTHHKIVFCD